LRSYKIHIFFAILFLIIVLLSIFTATQLKQKISEDIIPDKTEYSNNPLSAKHPLIRYTGRFHFNKDKVSFAQSGCMIEAKFSGTAIIMELHSFSFDQKTYTSNYFNVFLDDQEAIVIHTPKDSTHYFIEGLKDTIHHIRIIKRTEAACGRCEFGGFLLNKGDTLLALNPRPNRRIEFIGNSITAGYGNEDSVKGNGFKPETENNYYAFGATTARNLKAEYHAVCYSGKGIYRNYDHSTKQTLSKLYDVTYPLPKVKWDFKKWIPQVVVINLGTNDFATSPPPKDEFIRAYFNFLIKIKNHYPNTTIICLDGPMLIDGWPNGVNSKTLLRQYIRQAINMAKYEGYSRMYQFSLSPNGQYGYGANWHPNIDQHFLNAEELTEFIKVVMKW
jgi:lysophospholipase L1-like esterase